MNNETLLREALEAVRDKMQAAAYHQNYRQACIDVNEVVLDALQAVSAQTPAPTTILEAAQDAVIRGIGRATRRE